MPTPDPNKCITCGKLTFTEDRFRLAGSGSIRCGFCYYATQLTRDKIAKIAQQRDAYSEQRDTYAEQNQHLQATITELNSARMVVIRELRKERLFREKIEDLFLRSLMSGQVKLEPELEEGLREVKGMMDAVLKPESEPEDAEPEDTKSENRIKDLGLGNLIPEEPPEPEGYWEPDETTRVGDVFKIGDTVTFTSIETAAVRHNALVDQIRNQLHDDCGDAPGCHWGQFNGRWVHAAADYAMIIAESAGVDVDNDILDTACSAVVNDQSGAVIGMEFLNYLPAELLDKYEYEQDNLLPMHIEDVVDEIVDYFTAYLVSSDGAMDTSKIMLAIYECWPEDPICGYNGYDYCLMPYEVDKLRGDVESWIWNQEDEDIAPWCQSTPTEIAAQWHGGQASSLYSLASTSEVRNCCYAEDILNEINREISIARASIETDYSAHPNPVIHEQIRDQHKLALQGLLWLKFWVLCDAEWEIGELVTNHIGAPKRYVWHEVV